MKNHLFCYCVLSVVPLLLCIREDVERQNGRNQTCAVCSASVKPEC